MPVPDLSKLIITRVHSVTTIYTESNDFRKRPARSCWALIYKWEGETEYADARGKRTLSNAEHPVLLPQGCVYEWTCKKSGRFTGIEFDANLSGDEIISLTATDGDRLLAQLKRLERVRMLRAPYWELEVIEGTYHILARLLRAGEKRYVPHDKAQRIQPALEYILQHYDEPITNEQLSEMSGVSTVYFRKLFTDAVGISPIRYIQRIRIRKAKEMLRSDYGSIAEVARSLGFQNIYHFSKAFKAQTGVSPSAYMKSKTKP